MSALAVGLIDGKVADERTIDLPGGNTVAYTIEAIEKALVEQSS